MNAKPKSFSGPERRSGRDRRVRDKGSPTGRERRIAVEARKPDVFELEVSPSDFAGLVELGRPPKNAR